MAHNVTAPVLILTTAPPDWDVDAAARILIEERLVACVSVLPPMTSIYRWQGAVEVATERQVILKTTPDRLAEAMARLVALHPYDVPECVALTVSAASAAYGAWVIEATTRS